MDDNNESSLDEQAIIDSLCDAIEVAEELTANESNIGPEISHDEWIAGGH